MHADVRVSHGGEEVEHADAGEGPTAGEAGESPVVEAKAAPTRGGRETLGTAHGERGGSSRVVLPGEETTT